jgi:hypothetical protein
MYKWIVNVCGGNVWPHSICMWEYKVVLHYFCGDRQCCYVFINTTDVVLRRYIGLFSRTVNIGDEYEM